MKRKYLLFALALAAALTFAAAALAHTSKGTRVKLRNTDLGQVLANRHGKLLWVFAPDKRNKDVCVKKPGCTSVWPPVTTKGKPQAGNGINAKKLGTIKLPGGEKQVTYSGHPLYTWIADQGDGSTAYANGVSSTGGKWYLIDASGKVIKGHAS